MKQLKLSIKIIAGFAVAIIMMAVVVGIYQFSVHNAISGFNGLLKGDVSVLKHAAKVEAAMLQCRRDESDFLLHKNLKYQEQLHNHIETMKKEAAAVREIKQQSGDQGMVDNANAIIKYADVYRKNFDVLVDAQKKAGLDPDSGFQGAFREAAQKLQLILQEHNVDDLYTSLMELRSYEKEFSRLDSEDNRNALVQAIKDFSTLLEASPCNPDAKKIQQDALAVYKKAATKFMSIDKKNHSKKLVRVIQYHKMGKMMAKMKSAINSVRVSGAMIMTGAIRQDEKDYLLLKSPEYVTKLHDAVNTLSTSFVRAGVLPKYVDRIKVQLNTYTKNFDALVGEYNETSKASIVVHDTAHKIEPLALKIYQDSTKKADTQSVKISEDGHDMANTALALALIIVVFTIIIALFLARSITKPIDLIIEDLTGYSQRVDSSAGMVSSSSQTMAAGASQQAASIEETSATMEEMASMTKQNSDNSIQADNLMSEAMKTIKAAGLAMNNISDSMGEISSASEETSKIVKTIDEIAFQQISWP